MTQLEISLTSAQAEFLQLNCPYPLFVAGKGSGKSYTLGLAAVLDAQHSGNALIGVYEPSHELIRTVAMPNVEFWLQKFNIEYEVNKNDHTITTKDPNVGNFLFKSYDNPALIIGYETYSAHVDELDTLSTEKAEIAWKQIVSRNRQNLQDVAQEYKVWSNINKRWECLNKTRAYTSPEGYRFCYSRWVQREDASHQRVHGTVRDNPAISESYILEQMKTMTQDEIDAMIDGQFRNLTSGTVYNCYDRKVHNSDEVILENDILFIGCDFNVYNCSATVYVRRNGGRDFHAVAELHHMRDTPEMCQIIKERWKDKGHRIVMYPDSSGSAKHSSNASISDISILREHGFEVRAKPKNPDVRDRVAATNRAFSEGCLFINALACPVVADCLEQQAYNKAGKPDKDSGNDHQNDATTYVIAYEKPVRKPMYKIDFHFQV